jgi:hypothetical protein
VPSGDRGLRAGAGGGAVCAHERCGGALRARRHRVRAPPAVPARASRGVGPSGLAEQRSGAQSGRAAPGRGPAGVGVEEGRTVGAAGGRRADRAVLSAQSRRHVVQRGRHRAPDRLRALVLRRHARARLDGILARGAPTVSRAGDRRGGLASPAASCLSAQRERFAYTPSATGSSATGVCCARSSIPGGARRPSCQRR